MKEVANVDRDGCRASGRSHQQYVPQGAVMTNDATDDLARVLAEARRHDAGPEEPGGLAPDEPGELDEAGALVGTG